MFLVSDGRWWLGLLTFFWDTTRTSKTRSSQRTLWSTHVGGHNKVCVCFLVIATPTIRTETITNENLGICFRFRFCNGKATKIPSDFLSHLLLYWACWARTSHNGRSHYLQYKLKSESFFFRFRFCNSTERKSKIPGFLLFFFACSCFCEDGMPRIPFLHGWLGELGQQTQVFTRRGHESKC